MIEQTLDFLKTYVQFNQVAKDDLPGVIQGVYNALKSLGDEAPVGLPVRWQDTVTDDYLICLEDGRKMKILKRHLNQNYGLTPEAYREKWGLPADYPMVAKTYAEQRSEIAKGQGLGKKATTRQ